MADPSYQDTHVALQLGRVTGLSRVQRGAQASPTLGNPGEMGQLHAALPRGPSTQLPPSASWRLAGPRFLPWKPLERPQRPACFVGFVEEGVGHCRICFVETETSDLRVNVHEDRHSPGPRGRVPFPRGQPGTAGRPAAVPQGSARRFCPGATPGRRAPPHRRPAPEPRGLGPAASVLPAKRGSPLPAAPPLSLQPLPHPHPVETTLETQLPVSGEVFRN